MKMKQATVDAANARARRAERNNNARAARINELEAQITRLTKERDDWRLRSVSHESASAMAVDRMEAEAGASKQARKERDVFERAAVQLQDQIEDRFTAITGGHDDPADCPTYYDGCNCSVEALIHNIERAESAESALAAAAGQ